MLLQQNMYIHWCRFNEGTKLVTYFGHIPIQWNDRNPLI